MLLKISPVGQLFTDLRISYPSPNISPQLLEKFDFLVFPNSIFRNSYIVRVKIIFINNNVSRVDLFGLTVFLQLNFSMKLLELIIVSWFDMGQFAQQKSLERRHKVLSQSFLCQHRLSVFLAQGLVMLKSKCQLWL